MLRCDGAYFRLIMTCYDRDVQYQMSTVITTIFVLLLRHMSERGIGTVLIYPPLGSK